MGRQFWKPSNMLYPAPPVMVSCADEEGHANIMTAAWAGTLCSDPVMVSVSIRPSRYSHGIISRTGEFVINLPTEALAYAVDYCGVRSGRDVDKFEVLKLTRAPSRTVAAPSIGESPVSLECRVREVRTLGVHDLFIAEVTCVSVDESLLDRKGRLSLERAGLLAYVHGGYYALGRRLGTFGWSVRRKNTGGRRGGKKNRQG
ncbi:MAG: flavin reductase family protein [Lachnospiraceae bacterium]|nr:flavin reductase family protein [Lachnospiraceae bacterium]